MPGMCSLALNSVARSEASSCPPPEPTPVGPCIGTTSCSYYKAQCAKATTFWSKRYYCDGAPLVCATAGTTPFADCARSCLQTNDRCLNKQPFSAFARCESENHAFRFAFCTPCALLGDSLASMRNPR